MIEYSFYDPRAETGIYSRNLPHWRQDGVIYFVTFRLADSIPRVILEQWAEERRNWLEAHGLNDKMPEVVFRAAYQKIPAPARRAFERDQARKMFIELDKCHGACPFRNFKAAGIVRDALHFHDGTRIRCGDFVIMPNHVHWLMVPLPGHKLETILKSVKNFAALNVNRLLGRRGTLWQKENFDHIVRSPDELEGIRKYIGENSSKAKLRSHEYVLYRCDWL